MDSISGLEARHTAPAFTEATKREDSLALPLETPLPHTRWGLRRPPLTHTLGTQEETPSPTHTLGTQKETPLSHTHWGLRRRPALPHTHWGLRRRPRSHTHTGDSGGDPLSHTHAGDSGAALPAGTRLREALVDVLQGTDRPTQHLREALQLHLQVVVSALALLNVCLQRTHLVFQVPTVSLCCL